MDFINPLDYFFWGKRGVEIGHVIDEPNHRRHYLKELARRTKQAKSAKKARKKNRKK